VPPEKAAVAAGIAGVLSYSALARNLNTSDC